MNNKHISIHESVRLSIDSNFINLYAFIYRFAEKAIGVWYYLVFEEVGKVQQAIQF